MRTDTAVPCDRDTLGDLNRDYLRSVQPALPVRLSKLGAHDVDIRRMGDVAIIHARTPYSALDARQAAGRHTDV